MDEITVSSLITFHNRFGASSGSPLLIDVRRNAPFMESDVVLAGALRGDPEDVDQWASTLTTTTPLIVYCVYGHEVGKNTAARLRKLGFSAVALAGGIVEAVERGYPTRPRADILPVTTLPSRWVTRSRPKVDRIACPWLIRRFIDPRAEIHFVDPDQAADIANALNAKAFDLPVSQTPVDGYTHAGPLCTFDSMLAAFQIRDPALERMAGIIRGADTGNADLEPQSAGLLAVSLGLSQLYQSDQEQLVAGLSVYDALYVWAKSCQSETHSWVPST